MWGALPIVVRSMLARMRGRTSEMEEWAMHDFVVGLVFVVMVMAPCVVALTVKLEDVDSK